MEADALTDVGHNGFNVDAQAMAALLFDFLTHPDYRAQVKREFDGIHTYFEEYKASLVKSLRRNRTKPGPEVVPAVISPSFRLRLFVPYRIDAFDGSRRHSSLRKDGQVVGPEFACA